MEIRIGTKQMLKVLLIIAWIIFIGLCIEAGGFLTNAVFALTKSEATGRLWQQVDLSSLFQFDRGHFFVVTLTMSIAAIMKAWIFYLIIKILHEKKLDMAQPFSKDMRRFIAGMAYLALFTGLFSWSGERYVEWLVRQGVEMPGIQYLRLAGADVWLFMGVTLFVIAQLFKRGVEIQSENELTV
jgi:hypothetical protein